MAISIRTRFLAVSVTITAIALSLFTHVIYDKAIKYKQLLETNSFQALASQLLIQDESLKNLDKLRHYLKISINDKSQRAYLIGVIDDHHRVIGDLYTTHLNGLDIVKKTINKINENTEVNEGHFEINSKAFYWLKRDLNGYTDKSLSLLIIYPLSPAVIKETLSFFGVPLFISGIILLWCMVWASIILSSLVTKLQDQKEALHEQASDIEKARDEALQANMAKSSFLANMSHEIRTPLTSIIGFAESCLESNQSMRERYEATSTIIRCGNHLLNIINEILDISKIEAGKLEIETRPVKLKDLLHEVNMFTKILAQEKGLTFGINHSFPLPRTILTDQLRLKQILLNLCSNAIKFTNKGHVFLNVAFRPQTGYLLFEIVDTGIGISAEQQEKIFSPFQQADSTITREYGGTGLGLTLSKQLTEMLGGQLTVESSLDKGSHFFLEIKTENIDENELDYDTDYISASTEAIPAPQDLPAVSGSILVAEDSPDIQALVHMLISKVGADLTMVKNGKLAVEKTMEKEFDLVLLDIQMPLMDGLEALHQMRINGYKKPIFAMTANTMQQDQEKYLMSGFSGLISKPIDKKELYSVITRSLKPASENIKETDFITSTIIAKEPDLIELIDAFLERIPEITHSINEALSLKDWKELYNQIHQMKGIGGAFGYSILTKISEKIEFSLTSQDFDQIKLLVAELNMVCQQAIAGKDENHKILNQ